MREVFAGAGAAARCVRPLAAAMMSFDAYLTSDFMWTRHLRRPCRIQMFHGVGGKYGFDAPTESMRAWDRLFFVNRRRLANCVNAGAIDADSPAIRLIGMPKVDCLVDGSLDRDAVLTALGLDPSRPTVLYAPTWSPASSLNTIGERLVARLRALPINLIVKLHDRSRDLRTQYSGGVDWMARLQPLLGGQRCAPGARRRHLSVSGRGRRHGRRSQLGGVRISAARSADRPLPRARPDRAGEHSSRLRRAAGVRVAQRHGRRRAVAEVERALSDPTALSAARRAVAADLFHEPGTATARCAAALYEAVELEPQPRLCASRAGARQPARGTRRMQHRTPADTRTTHGNRQRNHAGVQRQAIPRRGDRSVIAQTYADSSS